MGLSAMPRPAESAATARFPAAAALVRFITPPSGPGSLTDRRLQLAMDVPVRHGDARPPFDPGSRDRTLAWIAAADWTALFGTLRDWDLARAADTHGRRRSATLVATALEQHPDPAFWRSRLATQPDNPWRAALAALAHLGRAHDADLAAAEAILDPFEPALHGAPLLAAAHYRLAAAGGEDHLALAFDDWADLDPTDPAVWRAHGQTLLAAGPAADGPIAAAAARCEWQLARWLGRGGYARFLLPLLGAEPGLWQRIDTAHLAAATLDLARHQRRDQYEVNRIAARLWQLSTLAPPTAGADLRDAYRQLLRQVLHELVPAAWALPLPELRHRIAAAFLPELQAGAILRATAAGLAPASAAA